MVAKGSAVHDEAMTVLTIGGLLALGLATEALGSLTRLPRVTLLVLFGVAIGPSGANLLPVDVEEWYAIFADIALLMVGFLLGGKLSLAFLRETGRPVLFISVLEVAGVAAVLFAGLTAIGTDPVLALLLAGMAPASAPAAIKSVVSETGAKGRFTDILLGVVAIDDAWGLIAFSVLLAVAQAISGGGGVAEALGYGAWELGGALAVGLALGLPAAYLTGWLRPGEPTRIEALAVVFLCGGLALWLEVSFLLAAMVAGILVANLARHHTRPFREIENIEWPFMILFFVLAGASLEIGQLAAIGSVGLAYVALRLAGLVAGGWLGGLLAGTGPATRRLIGLAITPQAGVALGMALVAGNRFPEMRDQILAVVIGSTVIFEIAGPVLTRAALARAGETAEGAPA
jgi:Kef-type K+ transport system membrane component KefB